MTSTRDLLFALTRQRFTPAHKERVEELCRRGRVNWQAVAGIAAREGVAPIVGVNLGTCDPAVTRVPASACHRLQGALFENVAFKAQRRSEFARVAATLEASGWDTMLLKSIALEAAGIYRHPWVTCARDLDIAVKWRLAPLVPDDAREVRTLLDGLGIESDMILDGDPHAAPGHHDLSMAGVVRMSLEEVWQRAERVRFAEPPFPAVFSMCPEDLLLTLCLNGCRKRYFRLKALFDIAETLEFHDDLDWDRLAARAREWECEGVAFAALRAADETLGLPAGARAGISTLLGRGRRAVLGSMVTLMRRAAPNHRFPLIALQYASLSARQRLRSTRVIGFRGPQVPTGTELAEARLPGE